MRGLVMWCDGGSHGSNPGPVGYGIHGYHYQFVPNKKGIGLKKTNITDIGYIDKDIPLESIEDKEITIDYLKSLEKPFLVTIDEFINISNACLNENTNNQAELLAMTHALAYAIESCKKDTVKVIIYSDSNYVVKGLLEHSDKWVKMGWKKQDGSTVLNVEAWKNLRALYDEILSNNYWVSIEWVKGHNGDVGNEQADKLATMGANQAAIKQATKDNTNDPVEFKLDTGLFKTDVDFHPFLHMKRFYFNPHTDKNDGTYYLGELGGNPSDDDDGDETFGKELADASLAVIKVPEKDPVIETIKKTQIELLNQSGYSLDTLVAGRLGNITSSKLYSDILKYGSYIFRQPSRKRPDITHIDNVSSKSITMVLDPPFLAMRSLTQFGLMEQQLSLFLNNEFKGIKIDITDSFFENDNLVSTITPNTKLIKIKTVLRDKEKIIPLTFGVDVPRLNAMKKISALHPKMYLLLSEVDEYLFKYSVIITTDLGCGIWMASYSSNIFI